MKFWFLTPNSESGAKASDVDDFEKEEDEEHQQCQKTTVTTASLSRSLTIGCNM